MKKFLPFVIAALMIPSVALAKGKPPTAGTHTNHGKAKVMYVLKGLIYDYTAYDSATSTPGSLTIAVSHSNRHGKLLVGQPPITVTSIAAVPPGDNGMVKIRASRLAFKSATVADVQNALMNQPAHQVIDWGPSS
jgi:hypothetical protein